MADYQIFTVGTPPTDYTAFLKTNDYNVTSEDVLDTWTDGNRRTRGNVVRTRISGSVKLVMRKSTYETFLSDWAAAKNADGTYTIGVHVNNATTATETTSADVFASMQAKVVFGTAGYSYYPAGVEVAIEFEEA